MSAQNPQGDGMQDQGQDGDDDMDLGDDSQMGADSDTSMDGEDNMDFGSMNDETGDEPETGDDTQMGDEYEESDKDSKINNDSTADLINSLTTDQRNAVRAYAESFLDDNEEASENGNSELAESYIFTKKQLRELNERLGDTHSDDEKKKFAKKEKNIKKKSPFNAPNFK